MKFFITCKEASRIISEGMDRDLPFYDRIIVRVHLLMCKTCGYYRKQIVALRDLLTQCQDADVLSFGPELPPSARERIKSTIRQQSF